MVMVQDDNMVSSKDLAEKYSSAVEYEEDFM
jgi:hypothetical protein